MLDLSPGVSWCTNFGYCKRFIYDAVTVVFEVEGKKIVEHQYCINTTPPNHAFVDFWCDQDLELYSYYQYLRQLRKAEGRLSGMNTAQAGDLVTNLGQ